MLKLENVCVLHDQRNHPEVEQVFPADEIVPGPHYDGIHYGPLDRMEQHMLDLRHGAEGPARDGLRQYFLQSQYELQEEHYVDDTVTLAVFPWTEMRRALAEVRGARDYPQRTVLNGSLEQDFLGVDLQQSAASSETVAPGVGGVVNSYPCSLISTSEGGSDREDDISKDEIEATGWTEETDCPLRTFADRGASSAAGWRRNILGCGCGRAQSSH